jgi:hypothetical protein
VRKSWQISRRTLLRGALGTAIALPFLEAMQPAVSRASSPSGPPKRLVFIHIPVGFRHAVSYDPVDTPSSAGLPYTLAAPMMPLTALQKKITIVSNLANHPAESGNGDAHQRGTASLLTCQPAILSGSTVTNGISVDQYFAQQAAGTALGSIQLGVEDSIGSGQEVLSSNISWQDANTPVAKETDPSRLFGRLFSDLSLTPDELARQRAHQGTVLHFANDSATALRAKLGKADQVKLDQYLNGIKELEARLATTTTCLIPTPMAPPLKYSNTGSIDADMAGTGVSGYHDIMFDMIVNAFACDITRVATFMFVGGDFSGWDFLGFPDEHHYMSHFPDDPTVNQMLTNAQKLDAICTWEMTRIAHLLSGLDAVMESDGSTLLDNTLVFVSSDVADGALHNYTDLPIVLAGGGGKVTKMGQHVNPTAEKPLADLFVSMLQFAGVNATTYGKDGTGPLSELMV